MILTAGDALLADIIAHPEDDGLRLIYADWLEENGQEERAEFVRAQCRIAALVAGSRHPKTRPIAYSCMCPVCEEAKLLMRRESELRGQGNPDGGNNHIGWGRPLSRLPYNDGDGTSYEYRRGFPAVVRTPLAVWLQHGAAIVAAHPIERVEISDMEPHYWHGNGDPCWCWTPEPRPATCPSSACLPVALLNLVAEHPACKRNGPWRDFAAEADAIDALSAACLALARLQSSSGTTRGSSGPDSRGSSASL